MNKFNKTLAIAAIAAVSMFSAQNANAQSCGFSDFGFDNPAIADVTDADVIDMEAIEGIPDDFDKAPMPEAAEKEFGFLAGLTRRTVVATLKLKKALGTKVSSQLAEEMVEKAAIFGYTRAQVMYYIGDLIED